MWYDNYVKVVGCLFVRVTPFQVKSWIAITLGAIKSSNASVYSTDVYL